jgi:hypothetical protein
VPPQDRQSLERDCFPPQTIQDGGTGFSMLLGTFPGEFMKSTSLLYFLTSSLVILFLSASASGQSFQRTIYHGPGTPQDVLAADLNQDGKFDLLTTQADGFGFIFLNRGNGIFPDGGTAMLNSNGFPATRAVAADFNGDGITDVAIESCSSGGLTLLILSGDADHNFHVTSGADNVPPQAASCTNAMALIRIANDTLPSVMFSSLDTSITIYRNDGTTPFPQKHQSVFGAPGKIFSGASVGDFNGDHLQDIAAVSKNPSGGPEQVVIFYQNPDGSFQPPVTVFTSNATLQFTQSVDFNDNQNNDLVVPFLGGPNKRAGVVALTNLGAGRFRSTVLLADPLYTFAGQKATAIRSHEKHDGVRGILVPFFPEPFTGDPVFAFFPAQGDTWGKPVYFDVPNGHGAQAVVTTDFNRDGRPDFAGVDSNNELLVFLNTTTEDTCAYPNHAGVRICSPNSDSGATDNSRTAKIHASASGGALPIVGMKAFIDDKLVAESTMNTLDASVPAERGAHTLMVSASDLNGKIYQSRVGLHLR